MTQVVSPNVDRTFRQLSDKFGRRRDELAAAAMTTLGELGYARTTLREIAARSGCSHGVLTYYFADKIDLIQHCVRMYKADCVRRYDLAVNEVGTAEELVETFVAVLTRTLRDESPAQRLWYMLRLESLIEPSFRTEVAAIDAMLRDVVWRIVSRYAELSGRRTVVDQDTAYAIFDGVFFRLVMQQAAGAGGGERLLAERVRLLMPRLLGAAAGH